MKTKAGVGLWLADSNGQMYKVCDLAEYNLDKPMAQASIMEDLRDAVRGNGLEAA